MEAAVIFVRRTRTRSYDGEGAGRHSSRRADLPASLFVSIANVQRLRRRDAAQLLQDALR
jgi:hypothetical protein